MQAALPQDFADMCWGEVPGATLTISGKEYKTEIAVREAWLSGLIPEADLKEAVIDKLDGMLEKVRAHFSQGEAAQLLAKILSYKKESMVPEPTVRSYNIDDTMPFPFFAPCNPIQHYAGLLLHGNAELQPVSVRAQTRAVPKI